MKVELPEIPTERRLVAPVYLDGMMSRYITRHPREGSEPDFVQMHVNVQWLGDAMVYVTPAMLVHIANEILTDAERACIKGSGTAPVYEPNLIGHPDRTPRCAPCEDAGEEKCDHLALSEVAPAPDVLLMTGAIP